MSSLGVSYDEDTRNRRALTRVGFWFGAFVLGTFAFAYGWNLYIGPYSEFYRDRQLEQRKARTYLTTTTCTDAIKRSQLEGYNQCESSERIVVQSVMVLAFFDLMDYMRICHKGICTIAGFNITSSAWVIFQLIIGFACILYIVSFFGLASSLWGRDVGMYQMPMTMQGAQAAAMYQLVMQHKQYSTENPYISPQQYTSPSPYHSRSSDYTHYDKND